MPNINKIKLSGTSYDIQDANATKTVELTQAQYDALVTGGTVDSNTFYVITDGEMFNPSGKVDTSAFTEFSGAVETELSGKTDESAFTAHTADTTIHVTTAQTAAWNAKSDFSGSYNDLTDKPTIPTVPTSNTAFTNDAGYITSNDITGKTDTTAFTAHTADTTIHVTAQDKTNWNAKSDFSGSYNDLTDKPTIPTVPTSNTAFTNDAGYITEDAISGKADSSAVTEEISAAVSGKVDTSTFNTYSGSVETALSGKQDTLSAGTNITIVDNVISAEGGGGKAISAGTNISVTTGETADTINCTLPITATSNVFNTISVGQGSGGGTYNTIIGPNARCDTNNGHNVFLVSQNSNNSGQGAYVNGTHNVIIGAIKTGYLNFSMPSFTASNSVVIGGGGISTDKNNSVAIGYQANVSGTTKTNINNQLTIDTSNQVYIYNKDNTEMICLQDQLGGGGGITSGEVQSMIDESISGKTDESAFTAHTADTTIHVTTAQTAAWDAKSNFSGSYNDLTDKPTIPTATSAVTSGSTDVVESGAVYNQLGGLKLVKLTQSAYDALSPNYDANTLYIING